MKNIFLTPLVLVLLGASAHAQLVTTPDLFSFSNGVIATSSTQYSNTFNTSNVNDNSTAEFNFGDTNPATVEALNFTGFDSAIGTLQFYNLAQFGAERQAGNVTIYYSANSTTSLATTSYTEYGSAPFTLTYNHATGETDSGNAAIQYAQLTGLSLPSTTQSVLFIFSPGRYSSGAVGASGSNTEGVGFSEIEGFAPSPTPEPGTYTLIAISLVSLVLYARARQKHLA